MQLVIGQSGLGFLEPLPQLWKGTRNMLFFSRRFKKSYHLRAIALGLCFLSFDLSAQMVCSETAGGNGICTSPTYTYGLCDYQGAFCGGEVAWCEAYGGTWSGSCYGNATCTGATNLTAANMKKLAENFFDIDHGVGSCAMQDVDSGWGASWVDHDVCWTVGPTYVSGIETQNARKFSLTGQAQSASPSCSQPATPLTIIGRRDRNTSCPVGYTATVVSGVVTQCVKANDQTCPVGNPAQPGTGNKRLVETDIQLQGPNALIFKRTYNSFGSFGPAAQEGILGGLLGPNWRSTYDKQIFPIAGSSNAMAVAWRDDGSIKYFSPNGNEIQHGQGASENLQAVSGGGWKYTTGDDTVELYDANGRLLSVTDRNGFTQTLTYSAEGQLIKVTDTAARSLNFQYDSVGRLATITDSAGNVYSYAFTSYSNLRSVTYPNGGGSRVYTYFEGASNSYVNALATVADENGAAYAAYAYDSQWRVQSSVLAPNLASGTINKYTFVYNSGTTVVTTPLGQALNYGLTTTADGTTHMASLDHACAACGGNIQSSQFDAAGYPQSTTDFNGQTTKYTYDDSRGLETQRIEANGASSARTTNTVWNANFRLPDSRSIVDAGNTTESQTKWVYNSRGQVLSRCEVDPAVSGATSYTCGSSANAPTGVRQTSYTYCEQAGVTAGTCPLVGLVLTVRLPRTDVSSVTTYSYYQTTDLSGCSTVGGSCHHLGDRSKISNALGQTNTYVSYDQNGRLTRVSDANGTITDLTYHPRGWLLTKTVRANADGSASSNDATTTFAYDNVGNVTRITQPDGVYLNYTYDAAHRMTGIADNLGDTITYTLDAAGNRISEATTDPANTLTRSLSRQYDQLNHLTKTLNAANTAVQTSQNPAEAAPTGITYTHGYDGNDNAIYSVDGNGVGSEQQYDPLNRLAKTLQDHAGTTTTKDTTTQSVYDVRDNLRSVTDPDGLITNYTYDGLNNLTQLQSPDAGTSGYTYDAAGNRITQTDARGIITTYTYDALNRLTGIHYPTSSLNVTYRYDEPNSITGCSSSSPVGRLTTMIDSSGSTEYCFDQRGNLTQISQVVDGYTLTTEFIFNVADRLNFVLYPSGDVVGYDRDSVGRNIAVTFMSGDPLPLVNNVSYLPFGPANTITFSNGRTFTKTYDKDYAISAIASSDPNGLGLTAQVDVLGNLTQAVTSNATRKYSYDALYRLTQAQDGNAVLVEGFSYGKTGDRTTKTLPGGGQAYGYASPMTSHRLQSVAGVSRQYDANGNTVQIGSATYTYDDRNRLSQTTNSIYFYNGKGERVIKRISGADTLFAYSPDGALLAEYTNPFTCSNPNFFNCSPNFTGISWPTEYIWLDGTLIGVVKNGNPYYVETDQLGSPRVVVQPGYPTSNDTVVWRWDTAASSFGENAPNQDPGNTGTPFTMNLRFPGQYFDAETGLNYNYYRDYESATGRYVESDLIGLAGGIDTYAYVDLRPLVDIDPSGAQAIGKERRQTRPCNSQEQENCQEICGSRGVQSCRRQQLWTIVRVKGGLAVYGWKDLALSCSCNETFCQNNMHVCAAGAAGLAVLYFGARVVSACGLVLSEMF